MSKIHTPNKIVELPLALVQNMVLLATSGLGLVVALAWNEFIKKLVEEYIDPILGKNGSIVSLFIYALAITFLAIFVTMQLSALEKRVANLRPKSDNLKPKSATSAKKSLESGQPTD